LDAWTRQSGHKVNVIDYAEHAVGEGTDAEAVAYVQLDVDGERVCGASLDRDVVSASLGAVLSALNRSQAARAQAA
jgi:2-isopropylmalate synthase